jgi:hypothetical protein
MGVDIDRNVAHFLPQLRAPSGVIVAGRVDEWRRADVTLLFGDVIHALNGVQVVSLDNIRAALDRLQPRSPVVLQISSLSFREILPSWDGPPWAAQGIVKGSGCIHAGSTQSGTDPCNAVAAA